MPVDPIMVSRIAAGLLQEHGRIATALAAEKVETASRARDYLALDLALLVLSEVERHQAAGNL